MSLVQKEMGLLTSQAQGPGTVCVAEATQPGGLQPPAHPPFFLGPLPGL